MLHDYFEWYRGWLDFWESNPELFAILFLTVMIFYVVTAGSRSRRHGR